MSNTVQNIIHENSSSKYMPDNVEFFQEVTIVETIPICGDKPPIESLSAVVVEPKIVATKLITTPIALSYEGQNLSGYKLIVELNLEEKIKYVSNVPNHSVHVINYNNAMKSVFVVVPDIYKGERVCDLIRKKKYAVSAYVEDVYTVVKDCRTIYKCVSLLVYVEFF